MVLTASFLHMGALSSVDTYHWAKKRMKSGMLARGCVLALIIAGGVCAQYKESDGLVAIAKVERAGHLVSQSCGNCHSRIYSIHPTPTHKLAIQKFTANFADGELRPVKPPMRVGEMKYQVALAENQGSMIGRGSDREVIYPIQYVIGGSDIYYFLTTLNRERFLVLPLAFDRRKRNWLDVYTGSLRQRLPAAPLLLGGNALLSFDTACLGCHGSGKEETR